MSLKHGKMENPQRSLNYWEPIFSPEKDNRYEKWNITNQDINTITGKKNIWIDIKTLENIDTRRISGLSFQNVDFMGKFNDQYFAFNNCSFVGCAFYKSTWKNVKFQKCSFIQTSFSLSRFENCDFRECTYKDISISGNEMKFLNTFIEPYKFISAAYTNLDPDILREKNVDPKYQSYRLEGTKSSAARMLLQCKRLINPILKI